MRLRKISVTNFRSLVNVSFPVFDTTVLVGENNAGKTALLDALKAAIPRSAFGKTSPFEEYDYHLSSPDASPKTSGGIEITLHFSEDHPGEWQKPVVQSLTEIIQLEPEKDLNHIIMRLSSRFDEKTDSMPFVREFLNFRSEPLSAKSQAPGVFNKFIQYVRFFYLSALRDCESEFSPKSQFWGRILRDLKISEEDRTRIANDLSKLNADLLKADTRLDQVRASLESVQQVVKAGGATSIHALPMQPWDFLSKAEVVIQSLGNAVNFPLKRHGQGVQSLAVLFLFQAYVDVLLKPTFEAETEAILALEEPEAHLHPQATRALTTILDKLPAQKLISTHSPYVLQGVPITAIRLFRRTGASTSIQYVRRRFGVTVPPSPELAKLCGKSNGKYEYRSAFGTLYVHGTVTEEECRDLMTIYPKNGDLHKKFREVQSYTRRYLSESELNALDTYAKRIRGEIFFARGWLLCEGQSEYMLLAYFAELLGVPLDSNGVSLIDFQNNGSPGAFVKLAINLGIPFTLICDDDDAGKKYVSTVKDLAIIPAAEFAGTVRPLNGGADLEAFMVANGFLPEYLEILKEDKNSPKSTAADPAHQGEVATLLRKGKTVYTLALIQKLRAANASAARVPQYFVDAINSIIAKVT